MIFDTIYHGLRILCLRCDAAVQLEPNLGHGRHGPSDCRSWATGNVPDRKCVREFVPGPVASQSGNIRVLPWRMAKKIEPVDELLDALVWMRRKSKKHEPVDDLIDALMKMRRKAKAKAAKRKLSGNRPSHGKTSRGKTSLGKTSLSKTSRGKTSLSKTSRRKRSRRT